MHCWIENSDKKEIMATLVGATSDFHTRGQRRQIAVPTLVDTSGVMGQRNFSGNASITNE